MLQDNEDWQAETPTIILTSQASKPRSTTQTKSWGHWPLKEALSIACPCDTWTRAYTDGSAEEAAKKWRRGRGCSLSSPTADPPGSLWLQGSSQQTTELKSMPCSQQPRPWTRKRDFLPTQCFYTDCRPVLQSLKSPGEEQIFSNIGQELSLLKNKTSVTLQ